jgi:uncharacterized protein YkwD
MLIQKISNTLTKGLILFVLTGLPATNIPIIQNQSDTDTYKSTNNSTVSKNNIVRVSAKENTKNKSHKNHFASYTCNENEYKSLLAKINDLRAENNTSKATLDGQLSAVACAHTQWMLKNQKFGHRGRDDTGFESRCLEANTKCTGESVLKNTENDFINMFSKAINDSSTKEKMLDPENKNIGFAYEQGVLTVIYR